MTDLSNKACFSARYAHCSVSTANAITQKNFFTFSEDDSLLTYPNLKACKIPKSTACFHSTVSMDCLTPSLD